MNFVQLCEELISEAELLEEGAAAILTDSDVKRLAQDMKEFGATFKKALASAKVEEHDEARKEQSKWRTKLKQTILGVFAKISNRASKEPVKNNITWEELDDYITNLVNHDRISYKPFRFLHSSNFEEDVRKQIRSK